MCITKYFNISKNYVLKKESTRVSNVCSFTNLNLAAIADVG